MHIVGIIKLYILSSYSKSMVGMCNQLIFHNNHLDMFGNICHLINMTLKHKSYKSHYQHMHYNLYHNFYIDTHLHLGQNKFVMGMM